MCGLEIYLRMPIGLVALDVEPLATTRDLFLAAKEAGFAGEILYFQGEPLVSDDTLLADLGICSECVIEGKSLPLLRVYIQEGEEVHCFNEHQHEDLEGLFSFYGLE